jgi:hypothetical protein
MQKMAGLRPGSTIGPKVRNFLANDDTPPFRAGRAIRPRVSGKMKPFFIIKKRKEVKEYITAQDNDDYPRPQVDVPV